jgi:hypothetical protein
VKKYKAPKQLIVAVYHAALPALLEKFRMLKFRMPFILDLM